jgi:uncharacterized membrane protein
MREIPQIDEREHTDVEDEEEDPELLKHAHEWVEYWGWVMVVVIIFLWPIATLPWGVFPKALFAIWTSIVIVWAVVATILVVLMPLVESADVIGAMLTGAIRGKPRTASGAVLKGV